MTSSWGIGGSGLSGLVTGMLEDKMFLSLGFDCRSGNGRRECRFPLCLFGYLQLVQRFGSRRHRGRGLPGGQTPDGC